MKNVTRFLPGVERLEDREVPALLPPVMSSSDGNILAVGDFNHDSHDDLATFSARLTTASFNYGGNYPVAVLSGSQSVSLGNGDGTFRQSSALKGVNGHYLNAVQVSDVNGDGHYDVTAITYGRRSERVGSTIVATQYTNVWLGRGNGTFHAVNSTTAPDTPMWIWPPAVNLQYSVTADFNRDGTNDSASVDSSSNAVRVWLGNPDGTYQSPRTFTAGPNPGSIAVGDFNGDGWTDIVVVNNLSSSSPTLSVLLNDGTW